MQALREFSLQRKRKALVCMEPRSGQTAQQFIVRYTFWVCLIPFPLPPGGGGVDRLILLWEYRKLLIIVMYCDEYFIYKIITNGFLPEIMCTAIHIAENSEFQRL